MSADWSDLRTRVLSAAVILVLGGDAVWLGGWIFIAFVVVATGVMMWELAQMTNANSGQGLRQSLVLAVLAGLGLAMLVQHHFALAAVSLGLMLAIGLALPRRDKPVFAGYAIVIIASGLALILLRQSGGLSVILWLIAVIIASDVMGYFVGRTLGGPKFWPRISPKKTWSGTVAGWIGAGLVGAGFWAAGHGPQSLIWFSPIVAFAGQMGDIAESAIKRRAGVKDSSNLIPGHGGFLDRFDALMFGAILVGFPAIIGLFLPHLSKVTG